MKILALVTDGFGGHGGIAQYNRDLINALAAIGKVRQVVVLPRAGDAQSVPAILRTRVQQEKPIAGPTWYSLRAVASAIRFRPDVIFCGHLYMAPLASALSAMLRKPLWLQVHGIEAWEAPSLQIRAQGGVKARRGFGASWSPIRFATERARLVTAVSRYTRQRLLSWARLGPSIVRVLPNTVGVPSAGRCSRADLRTKYGLEGRRVLLTVSRLDPADRYKGHDKVLEVLPRLRETFPNLTYVIIGEGDDRSRLERIAAGLRSQQCVVFTGRVERDVLEDYYRLADLFVMPSSKEGFGIVFLEAALHGLPVIGGNVDGSIDALAEGVIGTPINPDSPDELVRAIVEGLSSAVLPTAGQNVERFHAERFRSHLERLLDQAL